MKYLSLFSGIGGFELGIQQAYEDLQNILSSKERKYETKDSTSMGQGRMDDKSTARLGNPVCVGYSEIDKYAIQIYEKHFNHKNYGDITKINTRDLPDFDLLVGGFPCQTFSIAGKRAGFKDTRGTLFFEIARIIREKKPRLLLLENVKGLLSHDKGNTFYTIISTLDELGYDCQWQVLNSKNFGVPQNRERVFIIGHLRGASRPEVFPIGENDKKANELPGQQTNTLTARYEPAQATGSYIIESKLDAQEIKQLNKPKHSNDRVYSDKGISPTLNTMQGGNRQPFVAPVLTPDRINKRQNGRRIKEDGEPSFTLTAQDKHGVLLKDILENPNTTQGHIDYDKGGIYWSNKIRRLTPTECERLQSFPDGWTEKGVVDNVFISYKKYGNIEICNKTQIQKIKNKNVRLRVVNESKKPISVIASCTINDGKDTELLKKELQQINTEVYVNIAIEKSEKLGVWECVISITKCKDSTEMLYTWKKSVPIQVVMDIYEKQTESIPIEKLWKVISEGNCEVKKLSTILTVINSITNCLISSLAHAESMQVCIKPSINSSSKELKWEVLSLKTKHISEISDSSRYKTLGNAVTVNVIKEIIKKLI